MRVYSLHRWFVSVWMVSLLMICFYMDGMFVGEFFLRMVSSLMICFYMDGVFVDDLFLHGWYLCW